MLNKENLVQLGKIVAKADSSAPVSYSWNNESFNYETLNETLRKEFNEYAGSYALYRENKNLIFAVMEEILTDILIEAQSVFKADFIEREQAQRLADRQARDEAAAAKKKAEEDKKAEERYEATKAKAIKDFEVLAATDRPTEVTNEFYYSLGWLSMSELLQQSCLTILVRLLKSISELKLLRLW